MQLMHKLRKKEVIMFNKDNIPFTCPEKKTHSSYLQKSIHYESSIFKDHQLKKKEHENINFL